MTPLAPNKDTMKKKAPPTTPVPDAEGRLSALEVRINAGYLRLLRTILKAPAPRAVQSLRSKVQSPGPAVQSPKSEGRSPKAEVRGSKFKVQRSKLKARRSSARQPTAADYLSRFLCVGYALALMASGCASRPLKGGKAVITRKPTGQIEQTLIQGENPAQATKQTQETVKVRTYTVPTGSRVEQSQMPSVAPVQPSTIHPPQLCPPSAVPLRKTGYGGPVNSQSINSQPSTINYPPSTAFIVSAPMPVTEREETRAGTELGAAQKDTARELGAKLSSLKGIVWVGVGLFLFGLASLVYPPLKVVVASVTTSAALMFGGLALMVLPSLIVGNELLILGGVAVTVGGWFLAHRHGQLSGIVAASAGEQTKGSKQSSVASNQQPVTSNQ